MKQTDYVCPRCKACVSSKNAARHSRSSHCVTEEQAETHALALLEARRQRDRERKAAARVLAEKYNCHHSTICRVFFSGKAAGSCYRQHESLGFEQQEGSCG
ncbi:hypothetical protein H257_17810 [Aphanomyces astaci]|uniref:Uncharacterized protein n=1 Tax=Aphanomyces astaci TaxID=112090 RepID=W4FFF1_APHAT|nr:hypothetical protein H257_17810 [Aphanomyces astaci]ETV65473.1 hypothetical protein H257_17810 [Aphanomyces astaci]|eukprot:XP_009845055.1 hypothetical protein H257_17810 [Aphanomyces astaci]